jgi:hypothetical protein
VEGVDFLSVFRVVVYSVEVRMVSSRCRTCVWVMSARVLILANIYAPATRSKPVTGHDIMATTL